MKYISEKDLRLVCDKLLHDINKAAGDDLLLKAAVITAGAVCSEIQDRATIFFKEIK